MTNDEKIHFTSYQKYMTSYVIKKMMKRYILTSK